MTLHPLHQRKLRRVPLARVLALLIAAFSVVALDPAAHAQTAAQYQYDATNPNGGTLAGKDVPGADASGERVPAVKAKSWVLEDERSGEVLAGDEDTRPVPMASTTKMMTALLTLERGNLDQKVTVSGKAAYFAKPIYSNAGLEKGDVLSVRELLEAALIVSGNDAATALAEHGGGGSGQKSIDRFVGMMNRKAKELGLKDTHFENPTGLDARGHHSSARDLATIARAAMKYPEFRRIITTRSTVITAAGPDARKIPLQNINELLYDYPPATGVKTGTSPAAGACLVGSAAKGDESYIAVVLDAADRYGAAQRLLNYGFTAYDRKPLIEKGRRFEQVEVPYYRDKRIPLVAAKSVEGLVGPNVRSSTRITVSNNLPSSAQKGQKLGDVTLFVDGKKVGESALVAARGYEEAPLWRKLWGSVSGLWN